MTGLSFSWTLVQGCPGDLHRSLNWLLLCPALPSRSPAMAGERIGLCLVMFLSESGRAEQRTPSGYLHQQIEPSLPRSQAHARWLLAPAGMAVPCTQWALTLPELSLPRALPWQEAMLKKIGKKKGSLDRVQKKILPLCLLVLCTRS